MAQVIDIAKLIERLNADLSALHGSGTAALILNRAVADATIELPDVEVHEHRRYEPAICHFCGGAAHFHVTEQDSDYGPDTMMVCNDHKFTAFS